MRRIQYVLATTLAVAAGPAAAQAGLTAAGAGLDGTSPFAVPPLTDADVAAIRMPDLNETPGPTDAGAYDKYYFFHRDGTDVPTAYADIVECDGYASGLASGLAYQATPYPYAGTLTGAAGGALGNAFAAAIFGSAEKRRMRRVNMRTCMAYKGYERFGLSKARWSAFNFEEGLWSVKAEERQRCLRQQALVAARYVPAGKALGV